MPAAARLLEHWHLKLLAVILAVALWMFVAGEERGESVYTVPLRFGGLPPGLTVAAVEEDTLDIRVQGRRSILARLRERDLRAEVSLRDARPGEFVVRVLPESVTTPRGVKVLRVIPSRIRGTLAKTKGASG